MKPANKGARRRENVADHVRVEGVDCCRRGKDRRASEESDV